LESTHDADAHDLEKFRMLGLIVIVGFLYWVVAQHKAPAAEPATAQARA
jgi:hypothetical protein